MQSQPESTPQTVALFDDRPFFEKALQHGVQHGIIPAERLASMRQEAPKGMVQIARYFGTEFLRPELELARTRMVNLISLYLEEGSQGDLALAAQALRDSSLLSRSKGGSDMLKALITMPQNSHFGMQERAGFRDEHIPVLAKWTLRSLADYRAEKARRTLTARMVDAATWMAAQLELDADELADAGVDAEAVIRTALLARLARRSAMPDWPMLEKWIAALRKKVPAPSDTAVTLPRDLPGEFFQAVESVRQSVVADLPRLLDPALPIRRLLTQTPAFVGRYFWNEDALADVEHFERQNSAVWDKATGGHHDDSSLLTLFLRIGAGSSHATLLTKAAATSLIRKMHKSGIDSELPRQFIRQHAPLALQDDYLHLWDAFLEEAEPLLRSDQRYASQDALALLRRECNVAA
ncbi:MAG TPA: hypothetical protein PLJ46_06490 [Burkholderiaceae bacterium]|nr:hypothetical protein [Burkholderiaceae bacterium]